MTQSGVRFSLLGMTKMAGTIKESKSPQNTPQMEREQSPRTIKEESPDKDDSEDDGKRILSSLKEEGIWSLLYMNNWGSKLDYVTQTCKAVSATCAKFVTF